MTVSIICSWTQDEDDKESTLMSAEMVAENGVVTKIELAEAVGSMALIRINRERDLSLEYSKETLAILEKEIEMMIKEIGDTHTEMRRSGKYRLN